MDSVSGVKKRSGIMVGENWHQYERIGGDIYVVIYREADMIEVSRYRYEGVL